MAFWGERRGSAVSAVAAWPLSARPRHCRGFGRWSLHQPICRPPSSCIANQWFVEFAIYALASRLRASWMEARVTKAARFRQGLGVLGETPVFARTRRRYARPPSGAAQRRSPHVVAPPDNLHVQQRHLCYHSFNLPPVAAAIGPDQIEPRETPADLVRASPAQSRSWIAAEWTTTRIDSPSLSTKGVDFAALHLLAGAVTYLVVFAVRFSADLID